MERIFPAAELLCVSLVPRAGATCPNLVPGRAYSHGVPFLSLHFGLVEAYWSTRRPWRSWRWLENDFAALHSHGYQFIRGSITSYRAVIEDAASQFVDVVENKAVQAGADAIAVYGRGHWTMNAAAVAAEALSLPLYVIERGILPNTYIADQYVPYPALGSSFRSGWQQFRHTGAPSSSDIRNVTESRWNLYTSALGDRRDSATRWDSHLKLLVGQCLFDYNCLCAPFASATTFVEHVIRHAPECLERKDVLYRPHPLSPEEYPEGRIDTVFGPVGVDLLDPWKRLETQPVLYTWNSSLGLEASLVFRLEVHTLDPDCHYAWLRDCTEEDRRKYLVFLNEVSIDA